VDPVRASVWMVREPVGFYGSFFTPDPQRPLESGPPEPADFVALDYLLCRPAAPIRLLPIGLVGSRRFCSFHHDWDATQYLVTRQGRRPLGLAIAKETGAATEIDAFALDGHVMQVALDELLCRAKNPCALVAVGDIERRGALEAVGMRVEATVTREIASAPVTLCRYVR